MPHGGRFPVPRASERGSKAQSETLSNAGRGSLEANEASHPASGEQVKTNSSQAQGCKKQKSREKQNSVILAPGARLSSEICYRHQLCSNKVGNAHVATITWAVPTAATLQLPRGFTSAVLLESPTGATQCQPLCHPASP